jgi:cold shock CspA family protein
MQISRISVYQKENGWGFIDNYRGEDKLAPRRIFFHIHDWKGRIAPEVGMAVSFDFGPSRKPGMDDVAINIAPPDEVAAEILNAAKKVEGNGSAQ